MAKDFSLTDYFKKQYLEEAKKSTVEYVTDEEKSNAEKETNAMRSSKFTAYDGDGEQPYLKEFQQPKSFDPDTIRLVREMLEAADSLEFEKAANLRDEVKKLDKEIRINR